MLTLCGWDLKVEVDEVFCESDSCFLGAGLDDEGQRWLVLHRRTPDTRTWLCAEVSARMLEEVEAGRAEAGDVFRHSLTGTVEIVSAADRDEPSPDHCLRCAELPENLIGGVVPRSAAPADPARAAKRKRRAPPAPSPPARRRSGPVARVRSA